MPSSIRRTLAQIRAADPGTRFRLANARTRADRGLSRLALVAVGITVMVVSAVTFWIPGPNIVLVLAGLALVAGQSLRVATVLDHAELRAYRWKRERWDPWPHRRAAIGAAGVVVASCVAAGGWFAWRRFGT